MAETIRKVEYCYTTTADKAGAGAAILDTLRSQGVNLLVVHGFPRARRTQLDLVAADGPALVAAAKQAKIKLSRPKTAFLIEGDDRVGALAEITERLAKGGVNITALTAVCAGLGRFGAILWVPPREVKKAAATLGA